MSRSFLINLMNLCSINIFIYLKNLTDPRLLNSSVCETVMPIMLTVESDTRDEKEPGRERREVKSKEVKMK